MMEKGRLRKDFSSNAYLCFKSRSIECKKLNNIETKILVNLSLFKKKNFFYSNMLLKALNTIILFLNGTNFFPYIYFILEIMKLLLKFIFKIVFFLLTFANISIGECPIYTSIHTDIRFKPLFTLPQSIINFNLMVPG